MTDIDPLQFLQSEEGQELIEKTTERAVLQAIHVTSFSDCLKQQHLSPDLSVIEAKGKGKQLTIHGHDIVNVRAWTRFVHEQDISLGWLSSQAGQITLRYVRWLRASYTPRYQAVVTDEAMRWLIEVAKLAVIWHMMLHKHNMHRFCDRWAEREMSRLLAHRQHSQESMRAANHARKHGENTVETLVALKERFDAQLLELPVLPYEELPGLPEGTPDPLGLPPFSRPEWLALPPPPGFDQQGGA